MRSATAALILFAAQFSEQVLAHPGTEGHFHGVGIEHVLLFGVMFWVLIFAVRK